MRWVMRIQLPLNAGSSRPWLDRRSHTQISIVYASHRWSSRRAEVAVSAGPLGCESYALAAAKNGNLHDSGIPGPELTALNTFWERALPTRDRATRPRQEGSLA